jgi:hypothetical protein
MESTKLIDFSLRKSKSIQRDIIFDGLRRLGAVLDFVKYLYVGFGSVWFIEYEIAHRQLGIVDMVSIEGDPATAKRARFNQPYKTIEIIEGISYEVVPWMLDDSARTSRPWVSWLDYDEALDVKKLADIQSLAARMPMNSILLVTFNVAKHKYGKLQSRFDWLADLLGSAFAEEQVQGDGKFERRAYFENQDSVTSLIAASLNSFVQASFVRSARPGVCVPLFEIPYQDGAAMLTMGWLMCTNEVETAAESGLGSWTGKIRENIQAPHFTQREVVALRSLLPDENITVEDCRSIGVELEPEQLNTFAAYYRHYPTYAQTTR